MIRLFIFAIVRFLIAAVAIYFVLVFFRWLIRTLQGQSNSYKPYPQQGEKSKSKEVYKDVKDAEFIEIPDDKKGDQDEHHS